LPPCYDTEPTTLVAFQLNRVYDGAIMPSRVQITVDPDVAHRAQERARARGLSFAEYVRRLIDKDLGEPEASADPRVIFDLVTAGERTDIARDKDRLIGDAVADDDGSVSPSR